MFSGVLCGGKGGGGQRGYGITGELTHGEKNDINRVPIQTIVTV